MEDKKNNINFTIKSLGTVPDESNHNKQTQEELQDADNKTDDHLLLIGYGELEHGKMLTTVEEVAKFIVKNGVHGDVMITDVLDLPFITTYGSFINRAYDQDFLKNKLLPVLIPMQKSLMNGDREPDDF